MSTDPDDLELSDAEEQALHELQLGIEYVHRAYGTLLEFHHDLGHAMDRMSDAEAALRDAGHDEWADELRDEHLPAGAISDQWTFELVEEFSTEFLTSVDGFEDDVRDELADGVDHVTERRQKRRLRERAESERAESEK
ncbi:hypothetical protein [Natronolimnohabitans innermongolicus]|uniref:Uncharacterized protein n=1 Tax=Natronolimnohabitans innermongolicus JCM 12255 TaxID=1227499 RepID=L9WXB2_9EURY|nr:hypothetical protein [Natronolimnohabitans innermongolicus]ELY54037.1 hypothetical protein C493_13343 [Natronolimnohabitans innermongolicus JCM 12255]